MSSLQRTAILVLDAVVFLAWVITAAAAAGFIYMMLTLPSWATECVRQPRDAGAWSWRMIDGQKCWYGSRRVIPKDQLHWPQRVAADMPEKPSWLERSSDKANPAEIYFLTTVNGRGNPLEAYPPLMWRQPWLTPNSIMNWPLLIDIDRTPFAAWNKRIGE